MIESAARDGETLDSIGSGRIRLLQRESGYRFNLDAVLLAGFALDGRDADRPTRVVDLGTGCGVVALSIASWRPAWTVTAIEVQRTLADLARRNAALNGLPVEIIEGDWRTGSGGGDADLVVCNPPYFAVDRGQPCSDEEKNGARQEVRGTVADTARAARRIVRSSGSVRFVYVASRLPELMLALHQASLPVVRIRMVHPRLDEPANTALVESVPESKRPLVIDPPLIVHGPDGGFSPEVAALLGG